MKANNIFNRIFFSKEVKNNAAQVKTYRDIIKWFPIYVQKIEKAHDLNELIFLHKQLYPLFACPNLGPCKCGMFRVNDISELSLDNVYLGGIYGLWTFTAREWSSPTTSKQDFDSILTQYQYHLMSNMKVIFDGATKNIDSYYKKGY